MRSSHVDIFNHDEDAATYDQDVFRSDDPVRAGYTEVLDWIVRKAAVTGDSTVLELGSGTGNLTARLPPCRSLVCVDASSEMIILARRKFQDRSDISHVQVDILEYFDLHTHPFEIVVSTYALHHLTEGEKQFLFDRLVERLPQGGRALFGDLMLASAEQESVLADHYRSIGDEATAAAIEEEFFWHLDESVDHLRNLGLSVATARISPLSWGMEVILPKIAG